jgi:hypothetical protein
MRFQSAALTLGAVAAAAVADVQFFPFTQVELAGSEPRRVALANLNGVNSPGRAA